MNSLFLEGIEKLVLREVPKPTVKEGCLLVRVRSCGICGSDIRFFKYGDRRIKYPRIIGHEIAGEVVEIGKNVKGFVVGDRIAMANEIPCKTCYTCNKGYENLCDKVVSIGSNLDGGLSEYILLDKQVVKDGPINRIPDGISFDEAALAEPLGCVINGLEFVHLSKGDSLLVMGAGPIGCMMVNMARIMGADRIILADISDRRLEGAKEFGADYYINSSKQDLLEEIKKITDGIMVDVAVSACSSIDAHEQILNTVGKGGRINLFGGIKKDSRKLCIDSNILHYKQIYIGGSFSQTKAQHQKALEIISKGKIKTEKLITHRFGLGEIEKALAVLINQEGLKVIINP